MDSTPQEQFDEWYRQTHNNTDLASWEIDDETIDTDEVEFTDDGT